MLHRHVYKHITIPAYTGLQGSHSLTLTHSVTCCQIKAMPWFADIDFEKMLKMELKPPFIPDVKGDDDVSAVDEVFLVEPAAISATPAGAAPIAGGEEFKGFTFVVGGEVLSVTDGTVLES